MTIGSRIIDYYGYVYLIYDQKYKKIYVGQKKGKIDKSLNYYGSGKIIQNIIKSRGIYFLKKIVLGICYSKEELTNCETECKYFFNAFDKNYGYNIAIVDKGGDTLTYHPNKIEISHKISKSLTGTKQSKETIEKRIKSNTGKKRSNKTKEKQSKNNAKYWKNKKLSSSHKKNISNGCKGKICQSETKKILSIKNKGENNPQYGKIPWNKGLTKENSKQIKAMSEKSKNSRKNIIFTNEHKLNISNSLSAENNPSSKLTKKHVIKIRNLLKLNKYSIVELANKYNISASTIYSIKNYTTWKKI